MLTSGGLLEHKEHVLEAFMACVCPQIIHPAFLRFVRSSCGSLHCASCGQFKPAILHGEHSIPVCLC